MNQVYGLNPNGQERNVSYLPLSHVAASMMDNFVILSCRGTTYFADKSALKVENIHYFSTSKKYIMWIKLFIGNVDKYFARNNSHTVLRSAKSLGKDSREDARGWASK